MSGSRSTVGMASGLLRTRHSAVLLALCLCGTVPATARGSIEGIVATRVIYYSHLSTGTGAIGSWTKEVVVGDVAGAGSVPTAPGAVGPVQMALADAGYGPFLRGSSGSGTGAVAGVGSGSDSSVGRTAVGEGGSPIGVSNPSSPAIPVSGGSTPPSPPSEPGNVVPEMGPALPPVTPPPAPGPGGEIGPSLPPDPNAPVPQFAFDVVEPGIPGVPPPVQVTVVPVPAGGLLLIGALAALGFVRRRRA